MGLREPYPSSFRLACGEVVQYLTKRSPMALWMVIRVNGESWTIVDIHDTYYKADPALVYDWSVSLSYRMVMGLGPKVAPRCSEVPAYINAPAYTMSQIGSYIATPITLPNGQLFGVITGIDPEVRSNELYNLLPELEVHAQNLTHIFLAEKQASKLEQRILHLETPHWKDPETGAFRIEAWHDDIVEIEWARLNLEEAGGIIAFDIPNSESPKISKFVSEVKLLCEEGGEIYRQDANHFFVALQDLNKAEQQSLFRSMKKTAERRLPGSQCAYVYRDPRTSTANALAEAKKQLQSKRRKTAA